MIRTNIKILKRWQCSQSLKHLIYAPHCFWILGFSVSINIFSIISIEYLGLVCQICNLLSPLFADRGWAGIGKRGDCFYLLRMVTRMGRRLLTLYRHVYIPLHLFFIVLVSPHWHFLGSNLWFPPDCMWSSILCGVPGLWPSQCWEWRWTPDRSRAAATPPPTTTH